MEINNNITSILQKSLTASSKEIDASIALIAVGKQTNAIEDSAKMISSELMESEHAESQRAMENVQSGINLLQVADSGLSSISDSIQKIKDLALQRQNGTFNDDDKAAIDKQIGSLKDEINRVATTTMFNSVNLFDDNAKITINAGDSNIDLSSALSSTTTGSIGLDDDPLTLDQIDNALSHISSRRSQIGALSNGLDSTINSLQVKSHNLEAAQSTLVDTNIASETSTLTQNMSLQNISTSLLAQANQTPAQALSLI